MRILLILHDDSLSGAPIAAVNWITILKTHSNAIIETIIINRTGNFDKTLDRLKIKTYSNTQFCVSYPVFGKFAWLRQKIYAFKNGSSRKALDRINSNYDRVIFNSVVSLKLCEPLIASIKIKKFLLLHEMGNAIFCFLENNYKLLNLMDGIYSPSISASDNLTAQGIDQHKIFKLPLVLNQTQVSYVAKTGSKDELVVGNLANPGWPKGFDYFLGMAKLYSENYPHDSIRFIWKGFTLSSFEYQLAAHEINNAGLEHKVQLIAKSSDNTDFFHRLDLLAMTSKEDTYPFVMLEAAMSKIPVISFKKSGGAEEFINEFGGFTVPYLSMAQYVKQIKIYYENRGLLGEHGKAAHDLVLTKHVENTVLISQILEIFTRSGLLN